MRAAWFEKYVYGVREGNRDVTTCVYVEDGVFKITFGRKVGTVNMTLDIAEAFMRQGLNIIRIAKGDR